MARTKATYTYCFEILSINIDTYFVAFRFLQVTAFFFAK